MLILNNLDDRNKLNKDDEEKIYQYMLTHINDNLTEEQVKDFFCEFYKILQLRKF